MTDINDRRPFFPGLNELRALAALSVIPGHVTQFMEVSGPVRPFDWFPIPGKSGVTLFFVLSGFLITTLLIDEKKRSATVQLKTFYFKRMRRIWPIYFLIVGGSLFIFNRLSWLEVSSLSSAIYTEITWADVALLLAVMPIWLSVTIPYAAHTWSIGIEEVFYLFQPLAVKLARRKWTLLWAAIAVVALPETLFVINRFVASEIIQIVRPSTIFFGCIAIGCVCAVAYQYFWDTAGPFIRHRATQIGALFALVVYLVAVRMTGNETILDFRIQAIIFAIIILNAATNEASPFRLKSRVLNYLGLVSYGLYIYHPICIGLALAVTRAIGLDNPFAANGLIYAVSVAATIGLASASFHFLERPITQRVRPEIVERGASEGMSIATSNKP